MTTIIAGRFDAQARAEQTVNALEAAGFSRDRITAFFVNPAGQHNLHGTHQDPDASAGAHEADTGAVKGAIAGTGVGVAVGIASVPVLGPAAALAGAAVGAYVGSLHGALDQLHDSKGSPEASAESDARDDESPPRKSGMLVAVGTTSASEQDVAITVLRTYGAADLERAQGNIVQGEWKDFDPLSVPVLVTEDSPVAA